MICRQVLMLATLLTFSTPTIHGQDAEEEDESEQNRGLLEVDTCGTLGGHRVIYTASTEVSWSGNPFREAIEVTSSIVMEMEEEGETEIRVLELLTWQSEAHPSEIKPFTVKASGKDLKLFWNSGNHLVAHFVYTGDWIRFAPAFRKRIDMSLQREDNSLEWVGLVEILAAFRMWDPHIAQVVELAGLRAAFQNGSVDVAIDAMRELLNAPADDTLARHGKRLLDSMTTWKKKNQPATLESAKRIGKLLEPPFYPPLEFPTVFWQGQLLCVVQEDKKPATQMRTYDPRTAKWGKAVPVKYPETGMGQLYVSPNSVMMGGEVCNVCWHKHFGDPGETACEGLSCSPLIILNTPPGGSVESLEDRQRAGGSCAAGNGFFEFRGNGLLYPMEKDSISWQLFQEVLRYGSRESVTGSELTYPLVVSPDQEWVAYALEAKDQKGVELWVGRLKYNPDMLVR